MRLLDLKIVYLQVSEQQILIGKSDSQNSVKVSGSSLCLEHKTIGNVDG